VGPCRGNEQAPSFANLPLPDGHAQQNGAKRLSVAADSGDAEASPSLPPKARCLKPPNPQIPKGERFGWEEFEGAGW
jgi:hypothetical protein